MDEKELEKLKKEIAAEVRRRGKEKNVEGNCQ